jgi:hypothetical protein
MSNLDSVCDLDVVFGASCSWTLRLNLNCFGLPPWRVELNWPWNSFITWTPLLDSFSRPCTNHGHMRVSYPHHSRCELACGISKDGRLLALTLIVWWMISLGSCSRYSPIAMVEVSSHAFILLVLTQKSTHWNPRASVCQEPKSQPSVPVSFTCNW